MRSRSMICLFALGFALSSCGTKPIKPAKQHLKRSDAQAEAESSPPQPIKSSVLLPPPKPARKVATYSVVVTNVPAQEILFALARDAKINLDIQSGIQGSVTINAINQTLPEILSRIAKQIDMRYEIENDTLTVMPDTPFLRSYKIDYVNMSRDSDGGISNTTQLADTKVNPVLAATNNSQLTIKNSSKNHFWETLVQNIKDILRETDKILPEGSSEVTVQQAREASSTGTGSPPPTGTKKSPAKGGIENSPNPVNIEEGGLTITRRSTFREAASVIANPETGLITVRATGKQHEKIQEFVDRIMSSAQRQVLIEATIVEVQLSDNYQQGIDWSKFLSAGTSKGFNISQTAAPLTSNAGSLLVNYVNPTSRFGNITSSVSLLETFGNVKVLSSPKLSVMNNQTAMLRVADNLAYFEMQVTPAQINPTTGVTTIPPTYQTTLKTSAVGFTMSMTPQINDNDTVLINIRPSITRLLSYVNDPNPELAKVGAISRVPQTSTREMESVLKIENNQIAILGGLMEDSTDKQSQEVPLLGSIPLIGNLFKSRNDTTKKTELVIFLKPVVIKSASVNADFKEFRDQLPDENFFKESSNGKR